MGENRPLGGRSRGAGDDDRARDCGRAENVDKATPLREKKKKTEFAEVSLKLSVLASAPEQLTSRYFALILRLQEYASYV